MLRATKRAAWPPRGVDPGTRTALSGVVGYMSEVRAHGDQQGSNRTNGDTTHCARRYVRVEEREIQLTADPGARFLSVPRCGVNWGFQVHKALRGMR
jgi:hypothetical protein